ncbi:hypothetical protein [Halothiobacillus diazotrophicus]|uniref:hypothetical protein n=1 Tax=Halothiobacillus diazotrophicus TaxID=1860122 RepID=UPI0012E7C3CA|nr:hypothetical protein [Halothiobacillus diazotrophicus]
MKTFIFPFLLISATAFAQEPPYIYHQFGYSPQNAYAQGLSHTQQAELDNCIQFAKKRDEASKKNAEKMAAIYGNQVLQYDYFGVYITGCLADEKDGKGWSVQEKKGDQWERVRSRFAVRTFMKLDPTQ